MPPATPWPPRCCHPAGGGRGNVSPPAVARRESPGSPSWRMARSPPAAVCPCLWVAWGRTRCGRFWAASPVLARLRDRSQYHGKCGRCKRWSACRGVGPLRMRLRNPRAIPIFWPPIPSVLLKQINQEEEKNMVERPGVITMKGNPLTLVGQEVQGRGSGPGF